MKKSSVDFFLAFAILALATHFARAYVPSRLQDFLFVNGKELTMANDFFFKGRLNVPASTDNPNGFNVTGANVETFLGLNIMSVSYARFDYAPYGVNPPHVNPRASEVIAVADGTLYADFVHQNYRKRNRQFWKILEKGDVFVFPMGHPHFQMNNIGKTVAVAFAALNSQDPGQISIPEALFGSDPPVEPELHQVIPDRSADD